MPRTPFLGPAFLKGVRRNYMRNLVLKTRRMATNGQDGGDNGSSKTSQEAQEKNTRAREFMITRLRNNGAIYTDPSLKTRIHTCTHQANIMMEDRHCLARYSVVDKQVNSNDAVVAAILDGHAGHGCSDWSSHYMIPLLARRLRMLDDLKVGKENDSDFGLGLLRRLALAHALHDTDQEFFCNAEMDFRESIKSSSGETRIPQQHPGFAGACTLMVHVTVDAITVANTGDCRAIIAEANSTSESGYVAKQLTLDHTGSEPSEIARLRALKPQEQDVVSEARVKGVLQPTRSLGDGQFKTKALPLPGLPMNQILRQDALSGRVSTGFVWDPPYVSCQPDTTTFARTPEQRFLVLATDGVWDNLSNQEVADIVGAHLGKETENDIAASVVYESLQKAAKRLKASKEGGFHMAGDAELTFLLMDMPPGQRRYIYDDITVMVIDLHGRPQTGDRSLVVETGEVEPKPTIARREYFPNGAPGKRKDEVPQTLLQQLKVRGDQLVREFWPNLSSWTTNRLSIHGAVEIPEVDGSCTDVVNAVRGASKSKL
eukprot:Clim_evm16s253 gene=Clim_evmTU16s253